MKNQNAKKIVDNFLEFTQSLVDSNTKTYIDAAAAFEFLANVEPVPTDQIPGGDDKGKEAICHEVQRSVQQLLLAMSVYCAQCIEHDLMEMMKKEKNPDKYLSLENVGAGISDKIKELTDQYSKF